MIIPEEASVFAIEDHRDSMFVIQTILSRYLNCRYANCRPSGVEFFRLLEAEPELQLDLVLLDIQLPYEDGYAILQKIRQTPMLQDTKVVALTANVMQQDVERAQRAGFDGLIGKPIAIPTLTDQIRRVLSGEQVWEPE